MKRSLSALAALLLSGALLSGAHAASPNPPLTGKVLEVKTVDMYTYVRLQGSAGEVWAAVTAAPIKVGSEITIVNPMMMHNFESKALKRTFDRIVFGNVGTPGAAPGPSAAAPGAAASPQAGTAAGGMAGNPHAGAGAGGAGPQAGTNIADVKVPRAMGANARTVAEVVGKRVELKGKTVAVRGKVVKFSAQIMGRNWVHLRDGTGSAADGSNDIIVTTKDIAAVGDVVTAEGVVRNDVDLGSGYAYSVLVETATLKK